MKALELAVKVTQTSGYEYFAIKVEMNDFPSEEVIINPIINMTEKLEYWKNTYNEDLTHKYSNGIKIIDFAMGDSYEDIQWFFSLSDILHKEYDDDDVEDEK